MQNDIDIYTKTQVKPKIVVRIHLDLLITRKASRKSNEGGNKSSRKMVIAELGKRV